MKTIYQVYSRLKGTKEWLEDHMPFESRRAAEKYIESQYKTHQYMIAVDEVFESAEEELDFNDAWDAIGGDWMG